jgi:hypothetical protein
MKTPLLAALGAAALLSGCVQTYVSPVSVTRFLGDAPARLGQGPIAVSLAPGLPANSLELAPYTQAVAAELSRLGYQVVAGTYAGQVAEVTIARAVDLPGRARNPVSVGLGGSTGGYYGSGVGAGIGIDLTRPPPDVAHTQMTVTIRESAGARPLWEGRAEFAASSNSRFGNAQATAAKMAAALFAGFPGRSGETTVVR